MSYEDSPACKLLAVQCAICGNALVNVKSVESGIGPTCAERYGIDRNEATSEPDWQAYALAVKALPPSLGVDVGDAECLDDADAKMLAGKLLHAIAARVAPRSAIEAIEALGYQRLSARLRLVWREPKRGPSAPGYVAVRTEDSKIVCLPEGGKLIGSQWQAYLAACRKAGLRFDAERKAGKAWVGSPVLLPALCAALLDGEVPCSLDDTSRAALETEQDAIEDTIRATNLRIASAPRKPFSYQAEGARWLASRIVAILADEMGLGKTAQSLLAAPTGGIVVTCPSSVMGAWQDEFRHVRPEYTVRITDRKRFVWPGFNEAVIIPHDSLPDVGGDKASGPVSLIVDEAHKFKNPKADRTQNLRAMAQAVRSAGGRVWALTGTPIKRAPSDLWALMSTVGCAKEVFPEGWDAFALLAGGRQVHQRIRGGSIKVWEWEPDRISPDLAERVKPVMLRRSKEDNLPDLPPIVYQDHEITLSAAGDLEKLMADPLIELGLLTGAVTLEKLRAIHLTDKDAALLAGKLSFEFLSQAQTILGKAKIKAAQEHVVQYEEAEEPVVLAAVHRCVIDAFADREGWATIQGDKTPEERSRIVADFQAGKYRGVAVSIGAGAEGITLTRASHLVMVERDMAPDKNEQMHARIHRIGQRGSATIHNLRSNHPLEAMVDRILAIKAGYVARIVSAAVITGAAPVVARVDASTMGSVKDSTGVVATPVDSGKRTGEHRPMSETDTTTNEGETNMGKDANETGNHAKASKGKKSKASEPPVKPQYAGEVPPAAAPTVAEERKAAIASGALPGTADDLPKAAPAAPAATASEEDKAPSLPGVDAGINGGRERKLESIAIDRLRDNPHNDRQVYEGIDLLAASLSAVGLIEPISVVGPDKDGAYTIVAGHRRKRGALAAGWSHVPCQVLGHTLESDALTENGGTRRDLKPWELAEACYRMHQPTSKGGEGLPMKEVAKRAGFSLPHVKNLTRFRTNLIPEAWALFKGEETGSGNAESVGFGWAAQTSVLSPEDQMIAVLKKQGKAPVDGDEAGSGEEGDGSSGPKERDEAAPKSQGKKHIQALLEHSVWCQKILKKDAAGKCDPEEAKAAKKLATKVSLAELDASILTLKWVLGQRAPLPFTLPDMP